MTARTEARTAFGQLLMPTAAQNIITSTDPTRDLSVTGDFSQMALLQQLRTENRRRRSDRTTAARSQPTLAETTPVGTDTPPEQEEQAEVQSWNGDEYMCSICLEEAREHDRVCRMRCGHVFHTICWEQLRHAGNLPRCPNCREAATIIAIWHFIGPRPDPTQGQPNLLAVGRLDGEVQITGLQTPRSLVTDYDFGTPGSEAASSSDFTYPTFAHTAEDAQTWNGSMTLGLDPQTAQVAGPGNRQTGAQSYISNTELTDGRQALLIDPGS